MHVPRSKATTLLNTCGYSKGLYIIVHLSRKGKSELSYFQHYPTFPAWSGTCIMVLTELFAALPGEIKKNTCWWNSLQDSCS